MLSRRAILALVALMLALLDGVWSYRRYFRLNATITYAGLDSFGLPEPVNVLASKRREGSTFTDPAATIAIMPVETLTGRKRSVALVSLSPPSFGRTITAVRQLKARHICNVVIDEGAHRAGIKPGGQVEPSDTVSMALVLCDSALGDAGFVGIVPADRAIHVD